MVFNSVLVATVARVSTHVWQYVACNPERLSSEQILDLVCCLPLQQLGRLALCICSFLCLPQPEYYYPSYTSSYSSSSSSSDSSDSHSD